MSYEPGDNYPSAPPSAVQNEFYIAAWRRAFDFFGVASRTEFWSFVLINLALSIALLVCIEIASQPLDSVLLVMYWLFQMVAIVPTISVATRRFREVTGTGWFAFLLLLLYSPWAGSVLGTLMGRAERYSTLTSSDTGYGDVWRKTPDWLGLSGRKEYWLFALVTFALYVGSFIVIVLLHNSTGFPVSWFRSQGFNVGFGEIAYGWMIVTSLALTAPALPLWVRRMRDATGSGWTTGLTVLFLFVNPFLGLVLAINRGRDEERLNTLGTGYSDVWSKTPDFIGISKRGEFWSFTLITLGILVGASIIASLLTAVLGANLGRDNDGIVIIIWFLFAVAYFALSMPWFSLATRRVRDATGSGWWLLFFGLIFIGWLVLLVLFLLPSQKSDSWSGGQQDEEWSRQADEVAVYDSDDPWGQGRSGDGGR